MKIAHTCRECNGTGEIEDEVCISEYAIPEKHKSKDALAELKDDANRCISDHFKLVSMNPKAKESYDSQLNLTLAKLNQFAQDQL